MGAVFVRALAFAALLAFAPLAAAQTISAPLQVRTGEVFTVNVAYTQSAEIGEEEVNATMTYLYAVRVLDAEARLWRFMPISMSYEMPDVPGIDADAVRLNWTAISDVMSAMMRIATDVGFDCRVDEYGRCMEMTNWPFWSARVENMVLAFDGMARMIPPRRNAPEAAETPPPPAAPVRRTKSETELPATETLDPSAAIALPPGPAMPEWETVRVPVLQGLARLIDNFDGRDAGSAMAGLYYPAFVQGRTLTRRQAAPFTDAYEMPFGAPPLHYTGTLRLESINRRNNTAVVTRRASLDPASARAALTSMTEFISGAVIEPLAPQLSESQQPPDGAALAQLVNSMLADLEYEETTRGVIDLATGMARETTTDFTVSVRVMAAEAPIVTRGRIITRVTPSAPETPRLPRG